MRYFPTILSLASAVVLAACSNGSVPVDPAGMRDSTAPTAPSSSSDEPNVRVAPVVIKQVSNALEFAYSWPAAAAAIPQVDSRFRSDARKALEDASRNAAEGMKAARESGFPFHQHSFSREWTVRGETARLLSLESATHFYTGGAHPNHGFGALLWDKAQAKQVVVPDLFGAPADFPHLVTGDYCRALDAERLKRREGAVLEGEFAQCSKLSDLTILPSDKDGDGRFDTIDFIADPYVAGPYVEGEYDIPLPMTANLIAALKPEYRSSFDLQRQ